MESHTIDLEDFFDDLPILYAKDDSSTGVVRAHSDPHIHSLHDQSSQVGVIVDTYVQ